MTTPPTPAQRRAYADYSTDCRQSSRHVDLQIIDGVVHRMYMQVHRIPAEARFVVYVRHGATAAERDDAERTAEAMRRGVYAAHPKWVPVPRTADRPYLERITLGDAAPDPLERLELEILLDLHGRGDAPASTPHGTPSASEVPAWQS